MRDKREVCLKFMAVVLFLLFLNGQAVKLPSKYLSL